MVGGLLLGLIEALGAGYIGDLTGGVLGSNYQDIFALLCYPHPHRCARKACW